MFDWTTIVVSVISSSAGVIAGLLLWKSRRDEQKYGEQTKLLKRVDELSSRLTKVENGLKSEQVFSHRMVLKMQTVINYLDLEEEYRERHRDILPEGAPRLPNRDTLWAILDSRPDYDFG